MKRNKSFLLLVVLFYGFISSIKAQEIITDLGENPVLKAYYNSRKIDNTSKKTTSINDTLKLPFFDDFSGDYYYPDPSLWMDSAVFINNGFPVNQPSIGVATFDGLKVDGEPYDLNNPNEQGYADSLTSKPINLGYYFDQVSQQNKAYTLADSVYMSFYYESKGIGNTPEFDDSLILQFKNPTLGYWQTIRIYTYKNINDYFTQDIIQIDTSYLKNGFQFRFRNCATLSGALDHWHIDYIHIDKGRTRTDTLIDDVAFVSNVDYMLNSYKAMPWWQFAASDQSPSFNVKFKNNASYKKNVTYKYTLYDENNIQLETAISQPQPEAGEVKTQNQAVTYNFPLASTYNTYTYYTIKNTISVNPDINKHNDSIVSVQNLANYFSYDDGGAETGYGLNVQDALLAYKFSLNKPDKLVAIDIQFVHLIYNLSERVFNLKVWTNLSSAAIYTSGDVNPQYGGFYRYIIPEQSLSAGTFYVGWQQGTADILNVGFDRNSNSKSNLYYNLDGTAWQQSVIDGAVMIRPVFGDATYIGIKEANSGVTSSVRVYPNPANDIIQISSSLENTNLYYIISNYLGQTVQRGKIDRSAVISTSDLPEGFYILSITNNTGQMDKAKFIVKH